MMNKVIASFLFYFLYFSVVADQNMQVENLKFVNPEFYGSGVENSKYVIKAKESTQLNSALHDLRDVVVDYDSGNSKNTIFLTANRGLFNNLINTVELYENIDVDLNKVYKLYTDKIYVNFTHSTISSNENSEIKGPNERVISKGGFTVYTNERVIDFFGPIKTIINRQ